MPVFEPSHDEEAMRLYRQAPPAAEGTTFDTPDDMRFWEEFMSQYRVMAEARELPTIEVPLQNEFVSVSRAWASKFIAAWELFNCHTVTIRGPDNVFVTRVCHQFWQEIRETLGDGGAAAAAAAGEVSVTSNREPGVRVSASQREWNDLVHRWETLNGCTPEQRRLLLEQRRHEPLGDRQASSTGGGTGLGGDDGNDAGGGIPIPHMSLSLQSLDAFPPENFQEDIPIGSNFNVDSNFWHCLKRFTAWVPGAQASPAITLECGTEKLATNRVFLRRFLAAWKAQFPLAIVVAMAGDDGQPVSTCFSAHPAVWHELLPRRYGHASPEQQRQIPRGFVVCHVKEDTESPPILLRKAGYREVVRIWPDQYPADGKKISSLLLTTKPAALKGRCAPCVRLPKPETERPGRRKRVPGAPRSRRDVCRSVCPFEGGVGWGG